jgi:hypothetical protein
MPKVEDTFSADGHAHVWGDAGNDIIRIRTSKTRGSYVDCGAGAKDVLLNTQTLHRNCELSEIPASMRLVRLAPW